MTLLLSSVKLIYSQIYIAFLKTVTSEFYFILTSIKTLRSFFKFFFLPIFSKINKLTPTLSLCLPKLELFKKCPFQCKFFFVIQSWKIHNRSNNRISFIVRIKWPRTPHDALNSLPDTIVTLYSIHRSRQFSCKFFAPIVLVS